MAHVTAQPVAPQLPAAARRLAAEAARGFMPPDEGLALYETAAAYAARRPGRRDRHLLRQVDHLPGRRRPRRPASVVVTVDHHHGSEENQPGWEYHDTELVDPATGRLDTLPHFRATLAAAGLEEQVIAIVGRSGRRWPRCGARRSGMLFIDGGHTDAAAVADYEGWAPAGGASGGALAIHDVFPDPADGGQAPYRIYQRALALGRVHAGAGGRAALRVLERTGDGIG